MKTIWERIENWLTVHAPQILEGLNPGVTEEEIDRAEEFFGVKFPEDLKQFYRIHNGQTEDSYCLFPHLEFLSAQNMVEISQKWREGSDENFICDSEDVSEEIQNLWWHPHWIPFTMESNGACECVDLAPTPAGNAGQVIFVEWRESTRGLISPSFKAHLEAFADALERGEYRFSEDDYGLVDSADFETANYPD